MEMDAEFNLRRKETKKPERGFLFYEKTFKREKEKLLL
jgi:hypothetical protein